MLGIFKINLCCSHRNLCQCIIKNCKHIALFHNIPCLYHYLKHFTRRFGNHIYRLIRIDSRYKITTKFKIPNLWICYLYHSYIFGCLFNNRLATTPKS